jgi:hypothetical protein
VKEKPEKALLAYELCSGLLFDQADWRKGVALIASALGEENPPDLSCVRLADKVLRIRDEHDRALNFLEGRGYRRCDTPACNCGSWHKQEEA